jgi:hypothetical protein
LNEVLPYFLVPFILLVSLSLLSDLAEEFIPRFLLNNLSDEFSLDWFLNNLFIFRRGPRRITFDLVSDYDWSSFHWSYGSSLLFQEATKDSFLEAVDHTLVYLVGVFVTKEEGFVRDLWSS